MLSKESWIKIGKGALIAGVGAGLIYGIEGIAKLDVGIWAPALTAAASILINIVRKKIAELLGN